MRTPHKAQPGQPTCQTCQHRSPALFIEEADWCRNSPEIDLTKTCGDHLTKLKPKTPQRDDRP